MLVKWRLRSRSESRRLCCEALKDEFTVRVQACGASSQRRKGVSNGARVEQDDARGAQGTLGAEVRKMLWAKHGKGGQKHTRRRENSRRASYAVPENVRQRVLARKSCLLVGA